MAVRRVLIVDDESTLRTSLTRFLDRRSYSVITAASVKEAEALAKMEQKIDLALVDLFLPDGNGIDFMNVLKKSQPYCQTIVLTGHGTIQNAVEATKNGAYHFLTKPFNLDELSSLLERAVNLAELKKENIHLKTQLHQKYRFENIVGNSPEMTEVLTLIEKVSESESTVLITGESGTGKELVAQAIHYNSSRREKLIIPVNCGAIPAELLESELFGHVKGAFTGATQNRIGRFEMAHNGTIFLDEIGELTPALQVKLLRVIQERKFEPVGGTKTIEVNVRIVAATNRNLEEMISLGQFREDLYYRLNVIPIKIPALRERKSDIPLLLHHFMESFNEGKAKKIVGFSSESLDILNNYEWPGNVRELENLLERLSILKGEGVIQPADLPPKYQNKRAVISQVEDVFANEESIDFNTLVDNYENSLIVQALQKTGWNRNQAAQLLGLNRTTLVEKIKKKGLSPL